MRQYRTSAELLSPFFRHWVFRLSSIPEYMDICGHVLGSDVCQYIKWYYAFVLA